MRRFGRGTLQVLEDGKPVGPVYQVISIDIEVDDAQCTRPMRVPPPGITITMTIPDRSGRPPVRLDAKPPTIRNPTTRRKAQWKTEKKGYRP